MARIVIAKVLNNTRSKILGGTAVYQTGFDSDLGFITIAPASYESLSTMPAIGIVREDIEPGGEGVVVKTGLVGNINTSSTAVNAPVFVGSGGAITFTDPNDTDFDFYSQQLGTVTRVDDDEGLIDLFPLEVRPKIKHDEILEVREEQHHDPVTAKNIGGGAQVFKQIDRQAMTFRTLVAGEKIAITSFSDRIEIADNQLVDHIGQTASSGQVAYWLDSDTITGEPAFFWDTASGTLVLEDYLALKESVAPSLTSGYGKLFVKSSDSRLYFLNDSGVEFDLLAAGTGVPDTTFQDNKTFWNEAIYHLTIAADAYSASAGSVVPELTFQQNKSFWNEAIYHLRVAADGYAGGGGGTVTATQGSDGYLAFFTSANAIAGDNDLFWDRVNEGLRITATNLTVGGTILAKMKILRPDSRVGLIIEGDTGFQADMVLKAPSNAVDEKITQILTQTDGTFVIRATNDAFTTVTNNLFVGDLGTGDTAIGTTITTGARLHVYRNANFGGLGGSSLLLENPNTGGSGDSGVVLRNPVIDWFLGADRSDSSKLRLTPDDEPEFSSLGITILTTGEVGIGTKTPAKTLHVFKGSAGTIAATANASVVIENSTSSYIHMFTPDANESGILFGAPDMSIRTAIISPASSQLHFRAGGNITRMTLASNGNLGIGTQTPHATLTINGHIALEETAISPPAQDGYGYLYVKTDDKLYYRSGPGTEFDLTASTSGVTATQGADGYIAFFTGSNTIAGDNDLFYDRVNNRLGIGTSAPGDPLAVVGISEGPYRIIIDNESPNGKSTFALKQGGLYRSWFEHENDTGITVLNANVGILSLKTSNVESARLTTAGFGYILNNLGIQTQFPIEALTVVGSIAISEGSQPATQDGYGKVWVDTNGELNFVDDNGNNVLITSGGVVNASGGGVSETTFQENKNAQNEINHQILVALDGYAFGQTESEHYQQLSQAVSTIIVELDGYASKQTESEHYQQLSQAISTTIIALDGYTLDITFQENKSAQEEINKTILKALDGYGTGTGTGSGTVTSAQGSDGYVAFFTGPDALAGDNDLFWDRERNQLGIGTSVPNEKLTISGAISIEERVDDPVEEAGYGKLWVRTDGKLFFIKEDGIKYDLTAFTGDVDGGNFLDILNTIPAVDGGDF